MSTSGWCQSSLPIPRNAYGFPLSAGEYRAGNCCTTQLRRAPQTDASSATSVESLIVRNTLITSKQLGGSLTLQGSGSSNPTYEAALCVKAGARIDGLSQHGQLRVLGDSCMSGPVAMSDVYGPVTVRANPTDAAPAPTQLTVVGDTATTSLIAEEANITNLAVAGLFTVNGLLAGPLANAEVITIINDSLVSICDATGTYQVTGVAVSPTSVLTVGTWDASAAATMTVGDSVKIIAPRIGAGNLALAGIVSKLMPSGNAALIVIDLAAGYSFPLPVDFADDDSPAVGTPVVLGTGNVTLGSRNFMSGVVADTAASMFYDYTSIHVSVTESTNLNNGSTGAPIFNFKGHVIGMIQYGTLNSVPAGGRVVYSQVAGGIKGRYLKYFVESTLASPVGLPSTGAPFATVRGIGACERSVALAAGGVANVAVGVPVTDADQLAVLSSTNLGSIRLGEEGQNLPSFQDFILTAHLASDTAVDVQNGSAAGTYTPADSYDASLWSPSKGPPSSLCASLATGAEGSTNFEGVYSGANAGLNFVSVNFTAININGSTLALASGDFAATTNGSNKTFDTLRGTILNWGTSVGIANWFNGLSGADQAVKDAWTTAAAAYGTLPTYIFVSTGYSTSNILVTTIIDSTAVASRTVSIMPTGASTLDVVIGGHGTITYSYATNNYNLFSYITNAGVQFGSCKLPLTSLTTSWNTGTTTTAAIVLSTAAPTPVYV